METTVTKRIVEYPKENGICRALLWVIEKALKKTISIFYKAIDFNIAVISLDKLRIHYSRNNCDYCCKQLQRKHLPAIEKSFGKPYSEEFARRLETFSGYLIFHLDEIVGYAWASHSLIKNEGLKPFLIDIRPKRETIYLYDDFITPQNRNKGFYTRLMSYRLSETKKAGFKTGFLLFHKDNLPMRSTTSKFGFSIKGKVSFRRYLWFVAINTSALEKFSESNSLLI